MAPVCQTKRKRQIFGRALYKLHGLAHRILYGFDRYGMIFAKQNGRFEPGCKFDVVRSDSFFLCPL